MTQQPRALWLADEMDILEATLKDGICEGAAAELRRLHEANDSLSRVTLRISDEFQARITTLEAALRQAVEALEQIACYRPLTFAECLDAEAVMGIAENGVTAAKQALGERQ